MNEFEFPPYSGINTVFDNGGPVTIDFSAPILNAGAFFTYLTPLSLNFFDTLNNLVGTVNSTFFSNLALSGDPGSSPNESIGFTWASGISRMTITGDSFGGSFVMDDLTFTPASQDPIPEPSSLLLLGSGIVGMIWYRCKKLKG